MCDFQDADNGRRYILSARERRCRIYLLIRLGNEVYFLRNALAQKPIRVRSESCEGVDVEEDRCTRRARSIGSCSS